MIALYNCISSMIKRILLVGILIMFQLYNSDAQSFLALYNIRMDDSFSTVVQHGSEYYILSQDQPKSRELSRTKKKRLVYYGTIEWIGSLGIPAHWNDTIQFKKRDLVLMGNSLLLTFPIGRSVMKSIEASMNFAWVWECHELNGRDLFLRIVDNPKLESPHNPYYILSGLKVYSTLSTTCDVI